jgi:hypothetical protein
MRRCKPKKPSPIVVTSIRCTGTACPWTLEGWTERGEKIFVRYRWGILDIRLGVAEVDEFASTFLMNRSIFQCEFGTSVDGWLDYWTLKDLTKGVIEWPILCAAY